jgi:hypothetical protein
MMVQIPPATAGLGIAIGVGGADAVDVMQNGLGPKVQN